VALSISFARGAQRFGPPGRAAAESTPSSLTSPADRHNDGHRESSPRSRVRRDPALGTNSSANLSSLRNPRALNQRPPSPGSARKSKSADPLRQGLARGRRRLGLMAGAAGFWDWTRPAPAPRPYFRLLRRRARGSSPKASLRLTGQGEVQPGFTDGAGLRPLRADRPAARAVVKYKGTLSTVGPERPHVTLPARPAPTRGASRRRAISIGPATVGAAAEVVARSSPCAGAGCRRIRCVSPGAVRRKSP